MKFVSSVAALLLLSSAASYADTPDILNSVSQDSVQVMSKEDSEKTRGEYRYCVKRSWNSAVKVGCEIVESETSVKSYDGYYYSTQPLYSYTKGRWFLAKKMYVAR